MALSRPYYEYKIQNKKWRYAFRHCVQNVWLCLKRYSVRRNSQASSDAEPSDKKSEPHQGGRYVAPGCTASHNQTQTNKITLDNFTHVYHGARTANEYG